MIKIDLKSNVETALGKLNRSLVQKAAQRAITRTLRSTRAFAAADAAAKTKLKAKALMRAISVKEPKDALNGLVGELGARAGEFMPFSAYPIQIKKILKVPKNYKKKLTQREYQRVRIKFWGHETYKDIPGAFRVKLRGGNAQTPMRERKGRVQMAILMRVSTKRLKVRQLMSNQPDIAPVLNENAVRIKLHATQRMIKEFEENLRYYQSQQNKHKK